MSDAKKPEAGTIGWIDLTVDNADQLRDFYGAVVGWKAEPTSMGDYNDYTMSTPTTGTPTTGVCHARGGNAGLPSLWLIYITVDDLDTSMAEVTDRGGEIIADAKEVSGHGRYCVIRDPAGAVAALFEPS